MPRLPRKRLLLAAVLLALALPAFTSHAIAQESNPAIDNAATLLLHRARTARRLQAESLLSYSASVTQRLSLFVGLSSIGRQRLAYRHENAARVRWTRGEPIHVALSGSRSYVGAWKGNFGGATDRDLANAVPLPYFPGREQLWSGDGMVTDFVGQARAIQDSVSSRELVHPLASGAEAFYRYELGDSMSIRLPSGRRIHLRELRITAREPRWNLIVGAFWFDLETANLTRAAYRLSVPTDIGAVTRERNDRQQVPRWLAAFISPMQYEITAITIDFGLVEERFWLPRAQTLEGSARAGRARATMRIDQRFSYESARGENTNGENAALTADHLATPGATSDSSHRVVRSTRFSGAAQIVTSVPRDRAALARASTLPPSIFDESESIFDDAARRELLRGLGLGLQARWAPQRPTVQLGLPTSRYNRIEGVSTAIESQIELGRGYLARAALRVSVADRQVNGEFGMVRRTGERAISAVGYRRLMAMNDWGAPLSVSASVPAFLFGRDDGAYFRALGVELVGEHARYGPLTWRLFAEREQPAYISTRWSLLGSADRVLPNPQAERGTFVGASARVNTGRTRTSAGPRWLTDTRLELGSGARSYARVLSEATVSTEGMGPVQLTASGAIGTSIGELPTQRHFTVGGTHTIRGTRALSRLGNSMWMVRTEVGVNMRALRPALFGDIGWAGDRTQWRSVGRPLSGAGIGLSVFDGLVRLDVARGIHPVRSARLDFYLDARF